MVPVRLGGEGLNPIYESCLYALFTHDLCIGIIGGRPKHSLYFVGFQEESLIHLDPHLCQDAVMVTQPVFPVSSYHCSSPRKMALSRMDPSATLGFYCHSRTDFLRLMEELPEILTPKQPGFDYPIFEFVDGRCEDTDACTRQVSTEDQMAASLPRDTPLLPQDSEEFVFL
ncbi:Cysteine protease ATG4D [Penaeus vannamei]|uniref:Cysteine protease n=2 Tax=Penaeus vannamei TaxID=6689 RepID=A0A423TG99_PENVA|nr:Cysteine protease ATG4D [Penaeus vannamei]